MDHTGSRPGRTSRDASSRTAREGNERGVGSNTKGRHTMFSAFRYSLWRGRPDLNPRPPACRPDLVGESRGRIREHPCRVPGQPQELEPVPGCYRGAPAAHLIRDWVSSDLWLDFAGSIGARREAVCPDEAATGFRPLRPTSDGNGRGRSVRRFGSGSSRDREVLS